MTCNRVILAPGLRGPGRRAWISRSLVLVAALVAVLASATHSQARERHPHAPHAPHAAAKTATPPQGAPAATAAQPAGTPAAPAPQSPSPQPAPPGAAQPVPPPVGGVTSQDKAGTATPQPAGTQVGTATPEPTEAVEADVSTRSVAVTSGFKGSEVVVFGTVLNTRQESAESGLYDVVLVVEGSSTPAVVRQKSSVGGIWLNTSSLKYDRVPSYYAIVSTRPLDEVADEEVLAQNNIGFKNIRFEAALGASNALSEQQRDDYRAAIVRLKQKEGLYFTEDYGVTFIGKALFRSTVQLPSSVKVGPVAVHVLLFRDGELLSHMTSRVILTRQGLEHYIYTAAFAHPLLYGLAAVAMAVAVGLLASLLVRRVS